MAKRKRNRVSKSSVAVSRGTRNVMSAPALSFTPSLISPLKKRNVLTTSQHSNYSRSSSEAARLSQHLARVASVPLSAEKQNRKSKLTLAVSEPDNRKSSQKAREVPHCKKRPDSKKATRGSGGSKRFVPWCD